MKKIADNRENQAVPIEMTNVSIGTMQDLDFIVLQHVNCSVAAGEFWVVGAPQYSGKTDFLMTMAGLLPPAAGNYKFYGNETRIFDESRLGDRLQMGFVFENAELFHYLTVGENVVLPFRYHKNLGYPDGIRALDELLIATGLKPVADVMPANLPPSWHKRAALARALSLQPKILLADNPLGALDARHSCWWLQFFDALSRGHSWLDGRRLTIVVTTDDFRPWRGGGHRFALLKEKTFIPLGSWDDVVSSDEPLVKELLAGVEPVGPTKSRNL